MRSLMAVNLSPRINGLIFSANGRLMQNPAPPVANQNFIFRSLIADSFCGDEENGVNQVAFSAAGHSTYQLEVNF